MLNSRQKGFLRNNEIVNAVTRCGVLDTDQITSLLFSQLQSGRRIAQRRLKALFDRGKLKRARDSIEQPFYYYTGEKPGQPEHKLAVNWVYLWYTLRLESWEELCCFQYEHDYGILRADAFAGVKNKVTSKITFSFIELDIAESGNNFDKVAKYNSLYESGEYLSGWWLKYASGFPSVLVVTTNIKRLRLIQKRIDRENKRDLEFKVCLLDQINGECQNEDNSLLLPVKDVKQRKNSRVSKILR